MQPHVAMKKSAEALFGHKWCISLV